jgi:CheY-like chemotaxis protein
MKNKFILLVEDNPDDEDLIRRGFEKSHVANELVVVRDGVEALDYLFGTGTYQGRDANAMPTVVLLDLNLPKIGGLLVLERLRADDRTKLLPVVILTSSSEQEDILKGYDLGANSYVRKPVAFEEFAVTIKQVGLYWLVTNEPPPRRKESA